jgi:hypothetical protein
MDDVFAGLTMEESIDPFSSVFTTFLRVTLTIKACILATVFLNGLAI